MFNFLLHFFLLRLDACFYGKTCLFDIRPCLFFLNLLRAVLYSHFPFPEFPFCPISVQLSYGKRPRLNTSLGDQFMRENQSTNWWTSNVLSTPPPTSSSEKIVFSRIQSISHVIHSYLLPCKFLSSNQSPLIPTTNSRICFASRVSVTLSMADTRLNCVTVAPRLSYISRILELRSWERGKCGFDSHHMFFFCLPKIIWFMSLKAKGCECHK